MGSFFVVVVLFTSSWLLSMSGHKRGLLGLLEKITFLVLNLSLVIYKKLSAAEVHYPTSRIEDLNKDISSVHRYVSRAKLTNILL